MSHFFAHPAPPTRPRATPPPPLSIAPGHHSRRRERPSDRSSYSSTLTTSTSSGSSTLSALLVSPTTPTTPTRGWTAIVTAASPAKGDEREVMHGDMEGWDVRTPRMGDMLGVSDAGQGKLVGVTGRGDTKGWWAGTTPTNAKPDLNLYPSRVDAAKNFSTDIFSLQNSPVITPHGSPEILEAALEESPTLGRLDLAPEAAPRIWDVGSPALDDDSPTLGYDAQFPSPPPRPALAQASRLPTRMLEESFRHVEVATRRMSPKQLGKLPARYFEQDHVAAVDGHAQGSPTAQHPPSPIRPLRRPSSPAPLSRSGSSSTASSKLSTLSTPRIPKRSSSRADLKAAADIAVPPVPVLPARPPIPPARGSSLRALAASASSSTSTPPANNYARFPVPPSQTPSSSSAPSFRPIPRSVSAPTSLHRRSNTSSISFSTLETVPEAPRDLDSSPNGSWALRPRRETRSHNTLHRSTSCPQLGQSDTEKMFDRFTLRRPGSAMSMADSVDSEKPKRRMSMAAFSTLNFRTVSAATAKQFDAESSASDLSGPLPSPAKAKKTVTFRKAEKVRPSLLSLPDGWIKPSKSAKSTKTTGSNTLAPIPPSSPSTRSPTRPLRSAMTPSKPLSDPPPRLELSFIPSRPAPQPPNEPRATHPIRPLHAVHAPVDLYGQHLARLPDTQRDYYTEALLSLDGSLGTAGPYENPPAEKSSDIRAWQWPSPPATSPNNTRPALRPAGLGTMTASNSFATFSTVGGPITPPPSALGCAITLDSEAPAPSHHKDHTLSPPAEEYALHGEAEYEANELARRRKQMYGKYGVGEEFGGMPWTPNLTAKETAAAYRRRSVAAGWGGQAF